MNRFAGWNPPERNYSKLPHQFIDSLPEFSSKAEICIVLYVLRHTWGYGDDYKRISLDEFQNGRKQKDGTRIDSGIGMSINAIKSGIEQAVNHGFLSVVRDESDKARIKQYYSLSELDYQKLTPRLSEVDSQPSEVDSRTKKETNRKKNKEKKIPAFAAPPPPQAENLNGNHQANGSSGGPSLNGSSRPKKEPSEHQSLMAAYQDALGYKIPNGAQEGTAAKRILKAGYTTEQAIECYRHMKADDFWAKKHLSLQSVYKQLGAYVTGQNGNGLASEWQSILVAVGKPIPPGKTRPDGVSVRAWEAIKIMTGGWHRFKTQDTRFMDQLRPEFESAYKKVAT